MRSALTNAGLRRKIWTMDLMSTKCLRLLGPRPVRYGGRGRLMFKQEIGAPAQGCRSTPAAGSMTQRASVGEAPRPPPTGRVHTVFARTSQGHSLDRFT